MSEAPVRPVVTIDGPSGSGKGTISRAVAQAARLAPARQRRAVPPGGARRGARRGGPPMTPPATPSSPRACRCSSGPAATGRAGAPGRRGRDGRRSAPRRPAREPPGWPPGPRCAAALLERQRAFAQPPGLVADGRDMGTVVFPGAALKIFLTATPEERALRRYKQLKDKGSDVSLPALSREIAERDRRDQTRRVAPLRPADDACVIDSTGMHGGGGRRAGAGAGGRSRLVAVNSRSSRYARKVIAKSARAGCGCPLLFSWT